MLNKKLVAYNLRKIANKIENFEKINEINSQIKNEPIKFMNWFNENFAKDSGDGASYLTTKTNAESLIKKYIDKNNGYLIDGVDCNNIENSNIVFVYDFGSSPKFIGIKSFNDFKKGNEINFDRSYFLYEEEFVEVEDPSYKNMNPLFGYSEIILDKF